MAVDLDRVALGLVHDVQFVLIAQEQLTGNVSKSHAGAGAGGGNEKNR
jgi:hypothetical protein